MTRIAKEQIAQLLPHGSSMCLLDVIENWDEGTISCRTSTHRNPDNPLRYQGCLTVSAGLEYAAQAMGAHVGLKEGARQTEHAIGYVGSVRDVVFVVDRLDNLAGDLTVNATRLVEGDRSYMYRFSVSHNGFPIIEGRASIFIKADMR